MTQEMRHPNILPPLVIAVPEADVEAHLAAGWLLEEPFNAGGILPPTATHATNETGDPELVLTPERPRRNRRAGSDPSEETAHE